MVNGKGNVTESIYYAPRVLVYISELLIIIALWYII